MSVNRRLAEQADRLDVGNYPVRFGYRTLYSDMDPNRHLNNGAFGRLFEEGRADLHHRVIGMSAASAAANGLTLLLATITIEFLREGRYPGSVEVASAVLRVGASSYRAGPGRLPGRGVRRAGRLRDGEGHPVPARSR